MSLIRNERVKLFANALDRASTACLPVGIFSPSVAILYSLGGATASAGSLLAIASLFWLTAAFLLHALAQLALGKLR